MSVVWLDTPRDILRSLLAPSGRGRGKTRVMRAVAHSILVSALYMRAS